MNNIFVRNWNLVNGKSKMTVNAGDSLIGTIGIRFS